MKLADLQKGNKFCGCLAVRDANIRPASNQKNFLDLLLTDGNMNIPAKKWEYTGPLPINNTVIFLESTVDNYRGQIQLVVDTWRPAEPSEFHPRQFLPVSDINPEETWEIIYEKILNIFDPSLKEVLARVFKDYLPQFMIAPAAIHHHHNVIHGLLEHTAGVLTICLNMATVDTDLDMLITGAVLHDIGKIEAYDYSGVTIGMTDRGKLLGHLICSLFIVERYADILSPGRRDLLMHLIAAHHGVLNWGSPVEPVTQEALILHNADKMDVDLWKVAKAKRDATDRWTGKVIGFNREFYAGKIEA